MSMLGVTMLNEIVNGKHIIMPDQILENLQAGGNKVIKAGCLKKTVLRTEWI